MIGKWHLGGAGFEPTRQGFDLNIAGDATGSPLSYFAPFAGQGRIMPGLDDAPAGQYLTDRLTTEAERFLDANRARPFFLYMPHYAVHIPMNAKEDLIAKYPQVGRNSARPPGEPVYAAMLESLDESVGRIVAKVDQLGLAAKTLVVFTSDNGGLATLEGPHTPPTINAPLREGKGYLYEGGLRVPLIVRWPGRIAPGVENTPVWAADLSLTMKALCGLPGPITGDGVSLASLLTDGKPLASRPLFWHYPHYSNQGGRPGGAVRDGDWKLIEDYADRPPRAFQSGARRERGDQPRRIQSWEGRWSWPPNSPPGGRTSTPRCPRPTQPTPPTPSSRTARSNCRPAPPRSTARCSVTNRYRTRTPWATGSAPTTGHRGSSTSRSPATFAVAALIGCGNGSGGSTVEFRVEDQVLKLTVPVTGGFQQLRAASAGQRHPRARRPLSVGSARD